MMNYAIANFLISTCESFKIGKTSLSLKDRREMPDYKDEYPNIRELYQSTNRILVDYAEAEAIDKYISHPKCNNDKGGKSSVNDTMGDTGPYRVYIVWK